MATVISDMEALKHDQEQKAKQSPRRKFKSDLCPGMGAGRPCGPFDNGVCVCGKRSGPAPETVVLLDYIDAIEGGYVPPDPLTFEEGRAVAAIKRMRGTAWRI